MPDDSEPARNSLQTAPGAGIPSSSALALPDFTHSLRRRPRKKDRELFPFSSAFSSQFLFFLFLFGRDELIVNIDTSRGLNVVEAGSRKERQAGTRAIA